MTEAPLQRGIFEHLRELRDDWSDDFPEKIIFGDSGIKSKARKSWLFFVVAEVQNALDEELIMNPEAKVVAEALVKKFSSPDFIERAIKSLTQKEDVTEANRAIDIVLSQQSKVSSLIPQS